MPHSLNHIDEKIHQLKKKREKLQAQHALSFMKEAQKIFTEDFSPELALTILTDSWNTASETKRGDWKKRAGVFPSSPSQSNRKKDQALNPTHHPSGKKEIPTHEHP